MFRIKDLYFNITSANLDAFIDEDSMQVNWGLEVKGEPEVESSHGRRPKASSEIIYTSKLDELDNWLSLSGKRVSWKSKYDINGEMFASLYFFQHLPIYNSELMFLKEGDGLKVKWQAQCDVKMEPQYDEGLELYIETIINFTGIWCGRKSELECKKLLDEFFPRGGDLFTYTITDHGVSLLCPKV